MNSIRNRNSAMFREAYPRRWVAKTANEDQQKQETLKEEDNQMKSYIFPIVLESDEDVWRAYIPELETKGAATWGHTKDEALKNIQEVAQMVIEELLEGGEQLPPSVTVTSQPVVAVSVG